MSRGERAFDFDYCATVTDAIDAEIGLDRRLPTVCRDVMCVSSS